MHKINLYEALKERGHDPNLVIISEPARRKNIKVLTRGSNSLECSVDILKSESGNQRLPLRMVRSQRARRESEPIFQEKKIINFSSKSLQDVLSVSSKIMQRDTYPYSQYSRQMKHNVVSSSIKAWMPKSCVRSSSMSLQASGIIEDANFSSEFHDFLGNSLTEKEYGKSLGDENLSEDDMQMPQDIKKYETEEKKEISPVLIETNDNDTSNILIIETNFLTSHDSKQPEGFHNYVNKNEINSIFDLSI